MKTYNICTPDGQHRTIAADSFNWEGDKISFATDGRVTCFIHSLPGVVITENRETLRAVA